MNRLLALGTIAFLLSPVIAWSQEMDIVRGSRLRVTQRADGHYHYPGTVVGMSADSVIVRLDKSGERTPFAWAGLSRIEMSDGKKGHGVAGACIGLVGGAVIGGVIGALTTHSETDNLEDVGNALTGAGVGAVVGMMVGGTIGAHHKTEKWTEVEVGHLSMSAGAGRDGDIAVMLNVRF